jgi:hypothetical protein
VIFEFVVSMASQPPRVSSCPPPASPSPHLPTTPSYAYPHLATTCHPSKQINMRCYGDKPPSFLSKVPSGLLPVLELDGRVVTESGAWAGVPG